MNRIMPWQERGDFGFNGLQDRFLEFPRIMPWQERERFRGPRKNTQYVYAAAAWVAHLSGSAWDRPVHWSAKAPSARGCGNIYCEHLEIGIGCWNIWRGAKQRFSLLPEG